MVSSSSGLTRGSADAALIFETESSGVAARDARVGPEHDAMCHSFRRLVLNVHAVISEIGAHRLNDEIHERGRRVEIEFLV
jgi:hypothetical protein